MIKPMSDFLRRNVDAPFLAMTRAAMILAWRVFSIAPPALRHVIMVTAGGIEFVASICAMFVWGGEAKHIGLFMLISGLFLVGISGWFYRRASSRPWTVRAYKQALAHAQEARQSRLGTRLTDIFISGIMYLSSSALVYSGQVGEARIPTVMAILFTMIALSEFCEAAEPPHPDDGDGFARPTVVFG